MIDYSPFWETLEQSDENWYTLTNKHHMSHSTLHRLKHNKDVSTKTLNDLCRILNCNIQDIVTYIPSETDQQLQAQLIATVQKRSYVQKTFSKLPSPAYNNIKLLLRGPTMKHCANLYYLSLLACKLSECLTEDELTILSSDLDVLSDMISNILARQSACSEDQMFEL